MKTIIGSVFVALLCICGICITWKVSYMFLEFTQKECDCEKCQKNDKLDEQWFLQRFQKNISPFLTSHYNLSQEAFIWWKGRQSERRDFNFYQKTTQKIFEIIPAYPPVVGHSPHHCWTCAVVGNSGNLRRSHNGKLIDLHDSVFRINYGRTDGFEEDVGSKTTHRVIYPESAGAKLDKSTHLVFFPFKIRDLEWLISKLTADTNARSNIQAKHKDLVMVVNPAFMQYVHLSWLNGKGKYSSTGFMTVILALHICDKVSVFGFGADSDGNWSHYWEVLKNKQLRTGPHPGSAEYDLIEELARQGKLVFYKGF
ncbi:hypothetical protein NQD34_008867 [Periophthalmus magnuspinnatus]|uniref:CMP-N-acetylneuraminate-beta-galactosamide- alpha-2,3-sialyltransferase 1-like n=1 Tax=Periophthalmus magnuspinnatus TaxID=409849 RepID=UPI0022C3D93D|nr:CMP-N-acetylneuraminate-beta-galactosamide-alpha-2,3-sialyltransferase 1-like [Periophthalmus magnuspinnatus]KAJ0003769.1 hypothetical protein NQD34_008867 [Periophthalmus magnuspinnatus]